MPSYLDILLFVAKEIFFLGVSMQAIVLSTSRLAESESIVLSPLHSPIFHLPPSIPLPPPPLPPSFPISPSNPKGVWERAINKPLPGPRSGYASFSQATTRELATLGGDSRVSLSLPNKRDPTHSEPTRPTSPCVEPYSSPLRPLHFCHPNLFLFPTPYHLPPPPQNPANSNLF